MRLAVTADLHWGHSERGDAACRLLFAALQRDPPDLFLLAGDVGHSDYFGGCLEELTSLPCRKAVLPGNHDLWVPSDAPRDSLQRYVEDLPQIAQQHGFHYLDQGPLLIPEAGVALVGTINWYDYTWAIDRLRELFPDELERLKTKRFTRGRHNDANYVRMALDDIAFTDRVVTTFERHFREALTQVSLVLVATHHPPVYDLGFVRREAPTGLDSLLWDAFNGNRGMEEVLARHAERIAHLFCGHTHCERECVWNGIQGFNIGGDYAFKRLLRIDWPNGEVTAEVFTTDA